MFRIHLTKIYHEDKWLKALEQAITLACQEANRTSEEIQDQLYIDTATWHLSKYEEELNLLPHGDLENRRSHVAIAWKRGGKVGVEEIRAAADSFRGGAVNVSFEPPYVIITFIDDYGVPKDLEGFKKAVEVIIPAHLGVTWKFKYLLIKDIHEVKTIAQMDAIPLRLFGG